MRGIKPLLGIGLIAAAVAGGSFALHSQQNDTGVVASLLSRALSTPTTRIGIGSVSGALSSDVTIDNVTISDRDGVWIELDRARLVWRRTALLFRRLEIDRLEVGSLTMRRPPIPTGEAVSDEPVLPELPVKLDIKEFVLGQLALGAPVLGIEARLAANGAVSLGAPSEGLNLTLDARRLDAPGTIMARASYVPQTNRLDLRLNLDEPANGLLVNVLNVPGLPPAKVDLTGAGNLDDFNARLAFEAGDSIGANGTAQLNRDGADRRLTLALASRIEGMLPPLAKPIFAGTTQLTATVRFAENMAITIAPLTVTSTTARLDLNGTLSSEQVADLRLGIRSLPNAGDRTAADDVELRNLVFDATVNGPILTPRISAKLSARDARIPQGRMARLEASFEATPDAAPQGAIPAVPFRASAEASGIVPTGETWAAALGNTLSLMAEGAVRDGTAEVTRARIRTATANAQFEGRASGPALDGKLTTDVADLARFGGIAGLNLRGAANVAAQLSGVPNRGQVDAVLDGRLRNVATGIDAVDGLAGGTVTLTGTARKLPAGGFGFRALQLNGVHVASRFDGDVTLDRAALDAVVTVPNLERADKRLSGRGEAKAQITGTLDKPNVSAVVDIANARMLGRPVPNLTLRGEATDVLGNLVARATIAGLIDRKEARGGLGVAKRPEGGWRVDDLDLVIGSVTARGAGTLDAGNLAQGRLTVVAGDLDDLSPLALTRMAGQLNADASFAVVNGGQDAGVTARGQGMRYGDAQVNRLDARVAITDFYRRPVIDGTVEIDRAVVAGEDISRVRLTSRGTPQGSDISATAEARGFALDARGRVVPADQIRLELAALNARRGERRIALLKPATITLLEGGADIRSLALSLDQGRIEINGRAGSTYDLTVAARAVPLAAADMIRPDLGLQGTLEVDARITGPSDAPTGTWKASVSRVSAAQTRNFGLPAIDATGSGRFANGRVTLDANATAANAGSLRLTGSAPIGAGNLDLDLRGRINLSVANSQINAAGRRIMGNSDIALQIGGTLARPRVEGSASIAGASFADAEYGVQLNAITGRIVARGDDIVIERLTAQTPGGGPLSVQGSVRIDPAAGFPGSIRINGQRAALASSEAIKVIASLQLELTGALARDPRIGGRVNIEQMDVTVPERLAENTRPLPGTRYVAPPPQLRARLAAEAKKRSRNGRRGAPPFDATLDVTVDAPNRVFVRGRGIDAELGGTLRLTGKLSSPMAVGAFEQRRGRLQILGTRLDFTRARITFAGDLVPELDLVAQTRAADITATITVSGRATQPDFTFSSSPDLPQDEILSRLLFQRASGGLSPFQALQLAQAAAQFSGGGPDAFERIRRSLGVDNLDISTGSTGNPSVGLSRAISNRVNLGIKTGADARDTGVTVDIDLTRRFRLRGEATGNGGAAAGVGAEWEY